MPSVVFSTSSCDSRSSAATWKKICSKEASTTVGRCATWPSSRNCWAKFEYLHNISVLSPDYLTKNLRNLFNQFFRFLKEGGIDEYEDQQEYAPSGCVSFFTVHQSKGLEFPVVVVGSLEAIPRKQYTRLTEILESGYLTRPPYEPLEHTKYYDFRRLFYTAFSRAQNLLVLACHEKEGVVAPLPPILQTNLKQLPSWRDPAFIPANLPLGNDQGHQPQTGILLHLSPDPLRELRRAVPFLS